jgi:hypothetical protein
VFIWPLLESFVYVRYQLLVQRKNGTALCETPVRQSRLSESSYAHIDVPREAWTACVYAYINRS